MSFRANDQVLDHLRNRPKLRLPRARSSAIAAIVCAIALLCTAAYGGAESPAPASPKANAQQAGKNLPGFQNGEVPVAGGKVHYVRGGSGPVMVLLHGWPQTWWSWHKVMPALAKNYTVVAFDLPGLGQSSIPENGYDAVTTASRIRQAVHTLGYRQVNLLAHDMGALVAFAYARDNPEEVTKLGVLDSSLNGFGLEELYGLSFHFLLNQAPAPNTENMINNDHASRAYIDHMTNGFSYKPEAVAKEVYYAAYSSPDRRSAGYNYYRAWPQNQRDNLANTAKRLTMPVLAMGGDHAFGPGVAASFRQTADQVLEVVAPDSGHNIAEEAPSFVTDCALLFFGDTTGETPPPSLASCAVTS